MQCNINKYEINFNVHCNIQACKNVNKYRFSFKEPNALLWHFGAHVIVVGNHFLVFRVEMKCCCDTLLPVPNVNPANKS